MKLGASKRRTWGILGSIGRLTYYYYYYDNDLPPHARGRNVAGD